MRDIVFSPLSKFLARMMGPANLDHAIALTIIIVFLLVGVWHGVGGHYAVFGLVHGIGVVANHYYTIGLKKWLGRDGFKAYNSNRWIQAIAIVLTFCYVAGSMFFFANTTKDMKEIFSEMR
jgi:membrane protein involved in D-alanine export